MRRRDKTKTHTIGEGYVMMTTLMPTCARVTLGQVLGGDFSGHIRGYWSPSKLRTVARRFVWLADMIEGRI